MNLRSQFVTLDPEVEPNTTLNRIFCMDHQSPSTDVEQRIQRIRGQDVMLDRELARLYGVSTTRLNQQVRRNKGRFPDDFMFQLTAEEAASSRLQTAILKTGRGGNLKYLPYAFTEHGAVAAASCSSEASESFLTSTRPRYTKCRPNVSMSRSAATGSASQGTSFPS